jgi:hypothetical protein
MPRFRGESPEKEAKGYVQEQLESSLGSLSPKQVHSKAKMEN